MADLTISQLAWLRGELGATPGDVHLQEKYDRLGSVRDVAIEVVKERRNEWLESPLSASVSGVASVNASENVKALERQLVAFSGLDDDPSDDTTPQQTSSTGEVARQGQSYVLTRTRGR